jgi:glyoxylase-like metal-dependent hydrolase (beta-lactamase superfamily II)
MEAIGKNVYLESGNPGVVLGVLKSDHGLLMIDAPFRLEDQRTWRSYLINLGGGVDKLLVMLDTHIDRTLGIRAMESNVLGHENSVEILNNRPTSARGQDIDAGADWEPFDLPANIRWVVPDMTYSDTLSVYWDEHPVVLRHRPGAHTAGTWLQYDVEKILFVGDSVVLHQPPFLAWSDLNIWLEELELLGSETYKDYKIVSGRNGVLKLRSIEKMREFLVDVKEVVEKVASKDGSVDALLAEVPALLKGLSFNKSLTQLYHNRLAWGLEQYYKRHYLASKEDQRGEN